MDGIKSKRWMENFNSEVQSLQTAFDSFFYKKKLNEYYRIKVDDVSLTLSLEITDNTLPHEIKERLEQILLTTKPEDSI
ncbi:MAG TPA: hypothetical protein PKM63_22640 [Panacibacter sp.]|nr:hypothetical protein [Panacibacter sp.]HNP47112.1 hypothetical protein [Panacibacter sp.]